MKLKNLHVKSKRHTVHAAIAAFLLVCLAMGIMCFQYYGQLQKTVKAESAGYLQEISKQIGDNASRVIKDNFSVLGTVSTVLKNAQVNTYAQLQPIILEQQKYWSFQNVFMVDENGVTYDAHGKTVTLGGNEYLQDVIVNNEQAMSSAMLIDGKESVVFAIPAHDIVIDGTEIFALAASYELTTFDQVLAMSAFDGKGYSHIIQRDGSVVVRSSAETAIESGYNILSSLSGAVMDADSNFDQLKADIAAGRNGMVGFTLNGVREYMAYTPLSTQDWTLLTFVPVSVVNAKSELLMRLTLLICGFITMAFALLLMFLAVSFFRHKRKLEQIAYVDPITHGNTIGRFYELAEKSFEQSDKPQYALIYINVEKFKVLNEQFGRKVCDSLLCSIEQGISEQLKENECIGRLFADNFCVLAEYTDEPSILARFGEWYSRATEISNSNDAVWLAPIMEFGVFVISNAEMPFNQMIDRAKLALRETMRELHGKLHYAIYDDALRRQLFREKQLEDMMELALTNGEFQVYLQPKYLVDTETVGGAEALVRWISPTEGMIYPDEFIYIFEKNGFIIQLDLFVFEQVCLSIRKWLDAGLTPVKVSVNCSRMHLKNPLFLNTYIEICTRCNTPPRYIEIELTENVVFEDVTHLSETIDQIHAAGFGCSMDDFGSGYSSLNLIQDIPVDTIKLDKIFFRSSGRDIIRTESVIASIITMSKSLSMQTVAEGVEDRPHVDMLKRLQCDYIQGYYFAKPMPMEEFEKLTFGEVVKGAAAK